MTEHRRRLPRRALITAAAATILMIGSGAAGAALSQRFSDVPADHPFHDQIERVASGCVIAGYGDGTFRPAAPFTRQAAAAMLGRGLPVQLVDRGSAVYPGDFGMHTVASVTVEVPDLPDCQQHAQVTGKVLEYVPSEAVPPTFSTQLVVDGTPLWTGNYWSGDFKLGYVDLAPGVHTIELQADGVPAHGTITADAELGVTISALGATT